MEAAGYTLVCSRLDHAAPSCSKVYHTALVCSRLEFTALTGDRLDHGAEVFRLDGRGMCSTAVTSYSVLRAHFILRCTTVGPFFLLQFFPICTGHNELSVVLSEARFPALLFLTLRLYPGNVLPQIRYLHTRSLPSGCFGRPWDLREWRG